MNVLFSFLLARSTKNPSSIATTAHFNSQFPHLPFKRKTYFHILKSTKQIKKEKEKENEKRTQKQTNNTHHYFSLKMINFEDGFDARAYLSKLKTPNEESEAVAKINELSDLSTALSTEIDRRVGAHYEELVGQATALRDAAAMIREISKSIAQLQQALKQVKLEMLAPYERIKEKTQQLQSLHESAETIRTVLRFLQLFKTLKESAGDLSELKLGGDIPNLTRAAATHSEISTLMKDNQPLRGIPLVEGSREYIRRVGEALVSGADHVMTQGLETLNQADIANALQAYRCIGKLDEGAWDAASAVVDKATVAVGNALSSPGGEIGLWQRVNSVVEALIKASSQGWALGIALVKTRDTKTGDTLSKLTVRFKDELPINVIWRSLAKMTADKFALASRCIYNYTFIILFLFYFYL